LPAGAFWHCNFSNMKRFQTTLLTVLFLAVVSSALASAAKKTYAGSFKGQPCVVKATWYNWEGLGAIAGTIHLTSGGVVSFSGSNSQPGVIDVTAAGESFRLSRKGGAKGTSWTGSKFSFSEGPLPTPTPSPSPSASPSPQPGSATEEVLIPESQMPPPKMVDETYTGTWRGQQFTAQMRWAPGDEPQIVRRGRGTITLPGGEKLSIEGTQSTTDAAEFSIKPDTTGEIYKTTKTTREGNEAWESSSLTLTQTK
jgi:hypothetical protein